METLVLIISSLVFIIPVFAEQRPFAVEFDAISIGNSWQVLGPFQSGTREQQWGADPLEAYGGFRNITFDEARPFPSSLNGSVYFDTLNASSITLKNKIVGRKIPVLFPDIDWEMLQKAFGWPALQFQAWIRGSFYISSEGRYGVWIGSAIEFYLDGIYYDVGNLYDADVVQFNRGGLFLDLSSGAHVLEIRVVNDIRAFGGQVPPKVEVQVALRKVTADLVVADYDTHGGWVVPTVIDMKRKDTWRSDGCLAGEWASFALRNEGREWVVITDLRGESQIDGMSEYIRLAPGQQRSIPVRISRVERPFTISVHIGYHYLESSTPHTQTFSHQLPVVQNIFTPHQFTYIHPSGIVTSGIIKVPKSILSGKVAYMLFALHGAGVENNSPFWAKDAYRELDDINAYIIQPSGVTSWGDDWHGAWSFPSVENVRIGVHLWSVAVSPCLPVDFHFLFWSPAIVAGHSNGGQGAWYALTHWSDLDLWAGNPVSGYSSIQSYVPYTMWQSLDAKKTLIRDIALRSYDHALLAENAVPFPIHVKHGSADDNVPVWHSTRLVEIVGERGGEITFEEIPGGGHWFDGIMTHGQVGYFLRNMSIFNPFVRPVTKRFVIANPREMGQRGGIKVEQLVSQESIGEIEIEREFMSPIPLEVMRINTSNVRRFTVMEPFTVDVMHVDGQYMPCGERFCLSLIKDDKSGQWRNEDIVGWRPDGRGPSGIWGVGERHGRQLGPLAAIMDTPGPLTIVIGTQSTAKDLNLERIARNIAHNLYLFFGAEVDIRFDYEVNDILLDGNVISLGMEDENIYLQDIRRSHVKNPFALQANNKVIYVHDTTLNHIYRGEGVGAIYLHPLARSRVLMIICGTDQMGLEKAAKLFPYRTGVGQPDWIVVGPKMGVQGMQGVESMGYYSNLWDIERGVSYLS